MQIKISARHGHLDKDSQQFIRSKVEKLPHYFERLTSIEVTVTWKNDVHDVEILVSAEHKHDFVATGSHAELVAAVDLVVAKIEGQLRRYKEKVQDHRRRPSAGEVTAAPSTPDEE